ncbi:expressed unknown protein [Seminavis robusta]|uniref:VWFA domain-containing protein n=1 Tax=Seminavis robusta TaxID=568900 RepID=A0A9N8HKK6_9STRA|nr:expressed unknown protein [Seminavis robusta]|eukprot:Sro739_g195430.1 n/a (1861) ;mRNA; f:33633-40404
MVNITHMCLNPKFTLQMQMMLSFGLTAVVALGSFIMIGLYTASNSGKSVQYQARGVVTQLVKHSLSSTAQYVAETMTKKFNTVGGSGSLLAEVARGSLGGIPQLLQLWPGVEDFYIRQTDGDFCSYPDPSGILFTYLSGPAYAVTRRNVYPLDATPLPLDWQITGNVNEFNAYEHLPDRPLEWYSPNVTRVDTTNAAYRAQGICNPNETNPAAPTYFTACSDANNNMMTGGVLKPTAVNWHLYQKSKDIAWILKPLFEQHRDVKSIGVYFANDGAGSILQYPATVTNGNRTYESIGCEWMYTAHPRSKVFIGGRREIENCHPRGEIVPMREYNPLERGWCRDQVERDMDLAAGLSSASAHNLKASGPYLDAGSSINLWVLTFGEAVFDRLSHQFIGCTLVDLSVSELYDVLVGSSDVGASAEAALVRWDDLGTVVVASQWDPEIETENVLITEDRLNLGVTQEVYNQMRLMVDYNNPWDPATVHAIYHEEIFESNGKLIMMHPVPNVPLEYDPVYVPEYMVVISIDQDEAFGLLDEMDGIIDEDVQATWERIGMVGGIGFGVVLLCIVYISHTLTKPLRWMQKVAAAIVEGTDTKSGLAAMDSREARAFCAPRTEVTKLLLQFEKMIKEFSGDGAAEVAGLSINEVRNTFEWRRMYEDVYPWETGILNEKVPGTNIPRQLSITKSSTPEVFEDELTADSTTGTSASILSIIPASLAGSIQTFLYSEPVQIALTRSSSLVGSVKGVAVKAGVKAGLLKDKEPERLDGPPFVNRGENIIHPDRDMNDFLDGFSAGDHSFLFWWTTLLVGTPILVTAILISVSVASDTTQLIPEWLGEVKDRSILIERNSIITALNARSFFGEQVLTRFIRDLHVYSRVAGWLLFGAINRANSFTKTLTGADECKLYEKNGDPLCPWLLNPENTACDCDWNDPGGKTCTIFNTTSSRHLQYRYYEGQSDDTDALGTRMVTSFPRVAMHPSSTNWWNETEKMPGAEKQENAFGHETTYDRVRVTSAMAVVDIPLYNYNPGIGETKNLGTYIGFEHDGMMTAYTGCHPSHINYGHWMAKKGTPREELCPENKYGYDARCRGWFDTGKEKGGVYVTPPYPFASSDIFAGSATFKLVDPITDEFVGQALMDFLPDSFMKALTPEHTPIGHGVTGFPIIITPEPDGNGHDTLVGPGYTLGEGAPIRAIVLPFDDDNSTNRQVFENDVARKMRRGDKGYAVFTRSTANGDEEEVFLAYGPVRTRTLSPINASLFSAGCTSSVTKVYSIGFGITMNDLVLPFTRVEDKVNSDINQVTYISLALILAAVLSVLYMTYTMCMYISQPVLTLIAIVKSIQSKTLADELPELSGGSCEIYDVYESLGQLCKIVRFTNAAFFKGDRTRSYKVLEDALDLFVKMGNQKALGVANNNLGTMVLQEQMERSSTTAQSDDVYYNGMKYFNEAIRIGTFEYQNADFDDARGDFVKQLANRYFNRGMFYIVNRDHPRAPPDLEQTGIKDLERAKTLDLEAHMYWLERGQSVEYALVEFGCILRRARGMLTLIQDSDFRDVWGIDRLIDQASGMMYDPQYVHSKLFETVGLVARKQQINDLKIQLALIKDDKLAAAKIAIKMLVEDEYIIDTVSMNCVTTLNKYYNLHGDPMQIPNLAQGVKRDTRRGAVDSMREAKNVIFCLDYSGSMAGARMKRANQNLLWVYEEHCLDKDHVGFVRFNHAVDEKLYFDLSRKGSHQEEHESILTKATDAEGGTRLYAALNKCATMCLNSGNQYDSWIIALTDGESAWDFPAKQVIARIDKHNKKGGPQINVIIIGFEVPSQVGESVATITSITEKSLYIDARGGLDEMDNAFETVVAVITGTAVTMETF